MPFLVNCEDTCAIDDLEGRSIFDFAQWAEFVSVKVEEKPLTAYNLTVATANAPHKIK